MKHSWRTALLAVLALTAPTSIRAAERVDFAHDVLPLLEARCAACHTNGNYKAGVSMDTRETLLKSKAVLPGKSGDYRAALCRRPTADELKSARELLGAPTTDDGVSDLLWAVFMLPEFQFIR